MTAWAILSLPKTQSATLRWGGFQMDTCRSLNCGVGRGARPMFSASEESDGKVTGDPAAVRDGAGLVACQ